MLLVCFLDYLKGSVILQQIKHGGLIMVSMYINVTIYLGILCFVLNGHFTESNVLPFVLKYLLTT